MIRSRSFNTPDARRAAILSGELAISGADGEPTEPAATEPTEPVAATEPEPTAATEPAATEPAPEPTAADVVAAGDVVVEPEPEPLPEIPALAETLAAVAENDLRSQFDDLELAWNARRPLAASSADVDELARIRDEQDRILAELNGRTAHAQTVVDGLASVDDRRPTLPAPTPAFAGATASRVAGARESQPAAQQAGAVAPSRPRAVLLATAATDNVSPGAEMDFVTLGDAIDTVKGEGDGKLRLAQIPGFERTRAAGAGDVPELLSNENTWQRNMALIREATADWEDRRSFRHQDEVPETRTAAICNPLDIIRDIPSAFSTTERVAPIFPQRPAGRLGFQFMPSVHLTDVSAGTGIWHETDQASVDPTNPATWKPIVDVTCPPISTVVAEAVTAALRFDITLEMSNPERLQNFTDALMAQKARVKEARILAKIDSLSGAYTFTGDYGALPSFIKAINNMTAQLVAVDRMDEPRLTLVLPRAVVTLLGTDRSARAFGQELNSADVLNELQAGIDGVGQVVETLDWAASEPGYPLFRLQEPGDPEVPVPDLSGEYRVRLFDPTGAIYAESGEMNMGVQRSPDLLRMNKSQLFVEEFFMLAKHGPQHWATIDMQLCDSGGRAGFFTPVSCTFRS